MVDPNNFRMVTDSINEMVDKEGKDMKGSLKLSLGYLLKKAARFTKSEFIIDDNDAEIKKRDKFLTLLDCSWAYIFNDAEVQIEPKRETTLRRPSELPMESEVKQLKDYILSRIDAMVNDQYLSWSLTEYVELRSLIVSRLTLFNGRRGGEPARLLLREWFDAEKDTWFSQSLTAQVTDPVEQLLVCQFKLAYQIGKGGRKMVPVLIPNDCLSGLK